jgi:hypothetical protein
MDTSTTNVSTDHGRRTMTKDEAERTLADAIHAHDLDLDGLQTLAHDDGSDPLYRARLCAFLASRYAEIATACGVLAE